MSEWWWYSTQAMTVAVRVEQGRIVQCPPIVRTFLGQPQRNLERWLARQPGFRQTHLVYTDREKGEGDDRIEVRPQR